jgi:hypothetical protein
MYIWVWVLWSHTRSTWVWNFPIYIHMGTFLSHTRTSNGYLPTGYAGNGYPFPSLPLILCVWMTRLLVRLKYTLSLQKYTQILWSKAQLTEMTDVTSVAFFRWALFSLSDEPCPHNHRWSNRVFPAHSQSTAATSRLPALPEASPLSHHPGHPSKPYPCFSGVGNPHPHPLVLSFFTAGEVGGRLSHLSMFWFGREVGENVLWRGMRRDKAHHKSWNNYPTVKEVNEH